MPVLRESEANLHEIFRARGPSSELQRGSMTTSAHLPAPSTPDRSDVPSNSHIPSTARTITATETTDPTTARTTTITETNSYQDNKEADMATKWVQVIPDQPAPKETEISEADLDAMSAWAFGRKIKETETETTSDSTGETEITEADLDKLSAATFGRPSKVDANPTSTTKDPYPLFQEVHG